MLARGEVMLGRAMFGIFGDGKEVAQVALAHAFQPGDIRSGYYRDQTLMFALGLLDVEQFFAQVYANTDNAADPASSGRGMNAHFGTPMLDANGNFRPIADELHSSADSSPTGSQMPRLVGLAYASKIYRNLPELHDFTEFSHDGNEIAFGTIGNASCAEGVFWESLNAAGVLQVPMLLSIWDDGYGISVPNELQVTKNDIGALIEGFRRSPDKKDGYEFATAPGWDFPGLYETYQRVSALVRREHVPAVVHVDEVTQPLGPLDVGQPRALQVEGTAAVGEGARLPPADASLDASGRHRDATPSSMPSSRKRSIMCVPRAMRRGTRMRILFARKRRSSSAC